MFLLDCATLNMDNAIPGRTNVYKGDMVKPSKGEGKQRNCNKEVLEICPISHFVTGTMYFFQKTKGNLAHPVANTTW